MPLTFIKNQLKPEAGTQVRAALSVSRKILKTRLGNSVAQICTQGFQDWIALRQEPESPHFVLSPTRPELMGNSEHIFQVKERTLANGEQPHKINAEELQKITKQIKSRGLTRVCLNFLNSHTNPENLQLAEKICREESLEVYSHKSASKTRDELSVWRRNLLDASLASFIERIEEEFSSLESLQTELVVLNTEKGFQKISKESSAGFLFSREKALAAKNQTLIYLGPEEWVWIQPGTEPHWKSPWGLIDLEKPQMGFFSIQPGQELKLGPLGHLELGDDNGMDPGPVLWGRSNKLTVYDALQWELKTTPELRRSEKTQAKVTEMLTGLLKHSSSQKLLDLELLKKEFTSLLASTIVSDLSGQLSDTEILLAGEWGKALLPELKKLCPKWNIKLSDASETSSFWLNA